MLAGKQWTEGQLDASCPFVFLRPARHRGEAEGGGAMAKGTVDKKDGKQGKRGRPRKAASTGRGAEKASRGAAADEALSSGAESGTKEEKKEEKKKHGKNTGEKEKDEEKKARKALRRAVKEKVRDESTRIAETLVKKMIEGNMESTAVVLSMIEKKKDGEGSKKHDGLTAADLLGSEEEWEEETAEAMERQGTQGLGARD